MAPRRSGGSHDQDRQPSTVSASRAAISSAAQAVSGGSHSGACWSANISVCPAVRCRRACAVAPSTRKPPGADSSSRPAPPRAASPPGTSSRIGWIRPYSGTRGVTDLDVHLPGRAGQSAQQHPRGPGAQVVAALVAADRHRVGQHRGAGRGPEGRLQRHGLVQVGPAGLELARGPDREVPAGRVEDAGEDGGRVEPGEAQPVHRAGPAYQRRRAAVRQQGIVADRQAIHDEVLSSTGRRPRAGAARLR